MDIIKQRFEHWQSKLEDFQGNLEKELADIRQCKQEIQGMKNELMEELGEISQLSVVSTSATINVSYFLLLKL